MTAKTCSHVGIGPQEYAQSSKVYSKDKNKNTQVMLGDVDATKDIDPPLPDIPKEECMKAYKAKIQRDLETFRKIEMAKFTTAPRQLQEMKEIELCKTSNFLEVEYGFTYIDLMRNV